MPSLASSTDTLDSAVVIRMIFVHESSDSSLGIVLVRVSPPIVVPSKAGERTAPSRYEGRLRYLLPLSRSPTRRVSGTSPCFPRTWSRGGSLPAATGPTGLDR
jgi:hypothetical protein